MDNETINALNEKEDKSESGCVFLLVVAIVYVALVFGLLPWIEHVNKRLENLEAYHAKSK